jgi:O-antigen/teichoic acid export membrane protein
LSASSSDPYSARRVKVSLVHFLIGKGLSAVIGVAWLLILVRVLPAASYGVYVILAATLEAVQLSSSLGLHGIAHRFVPELRGQRDGSGLLKLLTVLCILRAVSLLVFAAAIWFFTAEIADLLRSAELSIVVVPYLLVIVFEGYSRYVDVLLDSLLLQGFSQISILVRNGLRLAILVFLLLDSPDSFELLTLVKLEVVAASVGAVVSTLLLFLFALNERAAYPGPSRKLDFKRYFSYSMPAYVAQVIGLVYGTNAIKFIMSRSLGALQLGAFGFASALIGMIYRYLPVFLLIGMVRPLFVSARQRPDYGERLATLANVIFKLNAFIVLPMIALFSVLGAEIASVLSAGKFEAASAYLLLLAILLLLQSLHATLSLVALAMEDGRAGMHGTFLALLGLGAGLALLPALGGYGLCLGLLISELIWCGYVASRMLAHGVALRVDWGGYSRMMLAAVVCWVAALSANAALGNDGYVALGYGIVVGLLAYFGACAWLKPFSTAERAIINRVLPWPIFIW